MNCRSIFLLLSALLGFNQGYSQSFTIYNYAIPEGLPSSEVYDVFQDSHGFLWFATDNGVTRFDGNNFQNYHVKDGLTDPVVFSFFEDYKKRIWFRTFSGRLSYFENDSIKSYRFNNVIGEYKNTGILNYIVTKDNALVFTARKFIGTIDSLGNLAISVMKLEGAYYISEGKDGLMGISDYTFPLAQLIIDGKAYPITISDATYQNLVFRAVRWKGKLYISMNKEIFEFDGQTVRKVIQHHKPVISIAVDASNHFWVGYLNGGAERYEDQTFSNPWKPDFLNSKSVTKVNNDIEGGLWFSTLENGVFHVPNLLIAHFPTESQSRIKGALGFQDHALVGDQMGALYTIDAATKKSKILFNTSSPILSLHSDSKNLWLSTNSKIYLYDNNLKVEKSYDGVANDYVRNAKGETFIFGANRFRKFDKQNNVVFVREIDSGFRAMHVVDSLLFLANRLGLQLMSMDLKVLKRFHDFDNIKISNIFEFNDSTLLITTIGKGFITMDKRSHAYRMYNTQNNFLADHIYSALMEDSVLWLGTEKGLIKLKHHELTKDKFSIRYLTKKSGLISDKIDFLLKVGNSIWAFSDKMFSAIPVSFSQFAKPEPVFYIDQIKVNNKVVAKSNYFTLPHDKNNIEVAFRYISFNNPNILLRYRVNTEESWNYITSTKIMFTSLAPGKYAFDLQYSSNNQDWIHAFPDLHFEIEQPWYGRWYNQVIAFLSLLTLGYLYFRYQRSIYQQKNLYLKIINEHQQKLIQSEIVTVERERNRISKELHDRVGTNLTAMKLTINQLLKSHNDSRTEEVEEQFQIAIHEIKEIIYALTPPSLERYGLFTSLKNYVGKLNKNIPIAISLKTFGKEVAGSDLNIILFRVIQELLNNSIKHSQARNITIHINSFEDVLNIVYEDDGIGFNYDPLQSGLGLDNIESRIHSVQGSLKFDSGKFGVSYTIDIPININKEAI